MNKQNPDRGIETKINDENSIILNSMNKQNPDRGIETPDVLDECPHVRGV